MASRRSGLRMRCWRPECRYKRKWDKPIALADVEGRIQSQTGPSWIMEWSKEHRNILARTATERNRTRNSGARPGSEPTKGHTDGLQSIFCVCLISSKLCIRFCLKFICYARCYTESKAKGESFHDTDELEKAKDLKLRDSIAPTRRGVRGRGCYGTGNYG